MKLPLTCRSMGSLDNIRGSWNGVGRILNSLNIMLWLRTEVAP